MRTSKYADAHDGEWIQPKRREYRIVCCDCGLVHRINVRIRNGRVQFQPFRDERASGQMRRWHTARFTHTRSK